MFNLQNENTIKVASGTEVASDLIKEHQYIILLSAITGIELTNKSITGLCALGCCFRYVIDNNDVKYHICDFNCSSVDELFKKFYALDIIKNGSNLVNW